MVALTIMIAESRVYDVLLLSVQGIVNFVSNKITFSTVRAFSIVLL